MKNIVLFCIQKSCLKRVRIENTELHCHLKKKKYENI